MSSPILPISGPLGLASPSAISGPDDFAAFVGELGADHRGLRIDARGEPPPAVLEQMVGADAVNQRLRRRGLELRFARDPQSSAPVIELHDSTASTVRRLTALEAMEIAAGNAE